ncbi:MAG TPA: MdtA/MuxA family multidrug efflux RND transporter periplasmic adaptor subunit [Burkholderiales bacterium]|nr:MdtA/MuxA family multidrug efflux RND transporter periplasmic adaptor subunit [Burkholderiales bacterium]
MPERAAFACVERVQPKAMPETLDPSHAGAVRRGSMLRRWWLWLALVLCAAGAGYFFWPANGGAQDGGDAKKKGRAAGRYIAPVVTAPVRNGEIDVYLNGLGSVVPLYTVTVRTRVDGELLRVNFREGQLVKQGELLAEIDPRPYQVMLTQAEGQMAKDVALLRNAEIDLDRYRTLFAQDSIAKQQLDTQEALVRQYEGTVKSDQGVIDNARLQLVYSRITAPISGRLGLRQVDPGNIVKAADANGLVVITQLQPITVVFAIPEDSLPDVMKKLRAGEKLPVDAFDRSQANKLASGTLLTVDNQIDPTTGTVKLKAQFDNADLRLFPNQFVNARLLLEVRRDTAIVPVAAIQRGTRGTFVYVVNADKTVSVRPVRLGPTQGESVAVEHGVTAGDQVVVDGADKLRDGATVELASGDAGPPKDPSRKGERKGGWRKKGEAAPAASQ